MRGNRQKMELTDVFDFGKHNGATVEDVIENHLDYITWAINEHIITLSNEAYLYYRDNLD